jgi:hypothetical protein
MPVWLHGLSCANETSAKLQPSTMGNMIFTVCPPRNREAAKRLS